MSYIQLNKILENSRAKIQNLPQIKSRQRDVVVRACRTEGVPVPLRIVLLPRGVHVSSDDHNCDASVVIRFERNFFKKPEGKHNQTKILHSHSFPTRLPIG